VLRTDEIRELKRKIEERITKGGPVEVLSSIQ